ncbi:TPA: hypothetical protein SAN82_000459 [Pseudomonas putida]|nr:hypothetical protein [Pseudomonas putida]
MNDATEQETDVSLEIEELKAILTSGTIGTPVLTAYLEAALAALESGGALPQAVSLTSEVNSRNDRPKKVRKTKSPGSLDTLGGGNIV